MATVETNFPQGIPETNRYDDDVEDFRRDLDLDQPEATGYQGYIGEPAAKDIDEEIKITKKRKPVAKLDADRYAAYSNSDSANKCSVFCQNEVYQSSGGELPSASSCVAKAMSSRI